MGTIYFTLKYSILSFLIVSLLQINIGNSSIETKLMSFVRNTMAPNLLGEKNFTYIKENNIQYAYKDFQGLKSKILESPTFKSIKENTKDTIFAELKKSFENEEPKEN